jgi:hypothetical protein
LTDVPERGLRKEKNGNPIKTDVNNPDPSKRNNPTIGMVILTNFI